MKYFVTVLILFIPAFSFAKTVRYELTATKEKVNLSGKKSVDFAIALNGMIPSPILEFTEGDEAEIKVTNNIPGQELSIHWHGILLPPEMDGVPYVNTPPIHSGESFTFKFPIRQHGTYWYHSHTGVQEQKGVYGAIVIHPKKKTINYDKDVVVVLSDWSDKNADQILRNLRKDGDYYLYKKDTMRSWYGAIRKKSLGNYLYNEWTRMGGMDLSDVGYDAFLINGKKDSQLVMAHPGEKIRIRVVNAAASSYFYISLGQTPMTVISSDGVDMSPVKAKEFLIGMAETYDILFTVPEHMNYELRATAQDGTGQASGWIGMGEKVSVTDRPLPDQYATMDHGSHGEDSNGHSTVNHSGHSSHGTHNAAEPVNHRDHQKMQKPEHESHENHKGHGGHDKGKMDHSDHSDHGAHANHGAKAKKQLTAEKTDASDVIESLTVDDLRSSASTAFPASGKFYDVKLVLDGDMTRYIWHINGKAIHQERNIEIKENDVIRFTFVNNTMMHHPMHLHGHFFRVVNRFGEKSPMKHTVDVPPHQTRVIEFMANEPGEWMLHCHNLYHLKTGMARVVKYSSFNPKPEIAKWQGLDPHLHDHWYSYGLMEASSNHGEAYFRLSQTWNQFEVRVESANIAQKQFSYDEKWDYEVDILYRRWFRRFFNLVVGGVSYGEKESAVAGFEYMLPFLVRTNWLIDHEGKFRLDVDKRFQWTKSVFTEVDFTWRPDREEGAHETELEVSLMYSPRWSWAAGLMLTNDSLGAGLEVQF